MNTGAQAVDVKPEPQITVTSGADRLSQREQIEQCVARAKERKEPVRIRIPFTLYDQTGDRGYVNIREAAWNMALPSEHTTTESVLRVMDTIGKCLVAIGQHGAGDVEEALRQLGDSQ